MVKYHFNKDTGRTGKCEAKIKCRLGLSESEHFETREEAKLAYEKTMSDKTFSKIKTTKKKDLNKSVLSNDSSRFLEPIYIKNSVTAESVFERFDEMNALMPFDLRDELLEQDKKFIESFISGEIPDEVPMSLQVSTSAMRITSAYGDAGYYAKVTKKFAKSLKNKMIEDLNDKEPVVLDPMAGKGYFTKAMREQGVKTIGSDDKSWSHVQTDDGIENLDALKSLDKYGNDITHLVISWAPYGSDIDAELYKKVRENFPHVTIVNIGENSGGCTGSERFWELLDEDVKNSVVEEDYDDCAYKTTYGLNDFALFMKPVRK